MFDITKIDYDALDRDDMESAASFVKSVAVVADIVYGASDSVAEMQEALYTISRSLEVAGTILYECARRIPKHNEFRKEIA